MTRGGERGAGGLERQLDAEWLRSQAPMGHARAKKKTAPAERSHCPPLVTQSCNMPERIEQHPARQRRSVSGSS